MLVSTCIIHVEVLVLYSSVIFVGGAPSKTAEGSVIFVGGGGRAVFPVILFGSPMKIRLSNHFSPLEVSTSIAHISLRDLIHLFTVSCETS